MRCWLLLPVFLIACASAEVGPLDASLSDRGFTGQDAAQILADATTPNRDAESPADFGSSAGDAGAADVASPDAAAIDAGASCVANVPCATNPGAPCRSGRSTCTGTVAGCADDAFVEDGTVCPIGVCTAGRCWADTSISGPVNLAVDGVTPGRLCAEAPEYSVVKLEAREATLTATPTAECLTTGDEAMLINLQGTSASYGSVGTWELLRVESLSGARVRFASEKTRSYGGTSGSDLGVGVRLADQKVALIRVPQFGRLRVEVGGTLTSSAWNGLLGGVVVLRAASLALEGSISAQSLGYRSGQWSRDSSDCDDNLQTESGESISGPAVASTARNVGGPGGLSALDNLSFNFNTPVCASAGHAHEGEAGFNPNGRVIGEPGGAYGIGDGSLLTMGSGASGNLTCEFGVVTPLYVPIGLPAAGIVVLLLGDLTIGEAGMVNATAIDASRDVAASGGYLLIRGRNLLVGDGRVSAAGAVAHGASGPTLGQSNRGSDGYVVLDATGVVTGTTTPPARVILR